MNRSPPRPPSTSSGWNTCRPRTSPSAWTFISGSGSPSRGRPHLTDSEPVLEQAARRARELGADFVCFGGTTLKEGRQKEHYLAALARTHPELVEPTRRLYSGEDPWVQAEALRSARLHIPHPSPHAPALFWDLLSRRDLAVVILEHLDYLYRLRGWQTPLGRAAWALSRLGEPGELGTAPPLSQTGG